MPPPQDSSCYVKPKSIITVILGLGIVFGQFIAFAPQLISIIRKKHVEGINLLTYLLGTVSCTAVFLSGLLESWENLFCCSVITPWHCMVSLISFMQVGVNWLNYFMIFCLLALYVKNTEHKPKAKLQFRLSLAVYVAWGVLGGTIITMAYLLVEGSPIMAPHTTGIYNKILGITGTVSIILQWSPQILTTFLHKGPGALSPITLSINSPGSMLTAFSQIAAGKSFSLWLPYVLSGAQQAVIVSLILYFYCTRSKKSTIEEILEHDPGFQGPALLLEDDTEEDEDDSLISNQRAHSDSEYNSVTASEEDPEEDDSTDDENPDRSLIRRKRRISARRSYQQQNTVSRSVPGYESLIRDAP